jgi:hypothetical protein
MAKPYSADLRTRVAAVIAEGETCRSELGMLTMT